MHIRQQREEEFPTIYDLVKVAFQTAKVSKSNGSTELILTSTRSKTSEVVESRMSCLSNHITTQHL